MSLTVLLLANAVFTFAGGIGLVFFPAKVTYGIRFDPQAGFLYRLLGVTAFSLAVLSFLACSRKDRDARLTAVWTFIVFHGLTAAVGILSLAGGISPFVAVNASVHGLFTILFLIIGLGGLAFPASVTPDGSGK